MKRTLQVIDVNLTAGLSRQRVLTAIVNVTEQHGNITHPVRQKLVTFVVETDQDNWPKLFLSRDDSGNILGVTVFNIRDLAHGEFMNELTDRRWAVDAFETILDALKEKNDARANRELTQAEKDGWNNFAELRGLDEELEKFAL